MSNFPTLAGHNKINNLRIERLLLQETGTYNDQYIRPYETTMDGNVQNAIINTVSNMDTPVLDPFVFSNVANSFIKRQAAPEAKAGIANGWNQRRIRFMLVVSYDFHTGGNKREYIMGYTDFNGITTAGALAPDMVFHINSNVSTRTLVMQTPMGLQEVENIIDSNQYLQSATEPSIYNPNKVFSLRPSELYLYMGDPLTYNGMQAGDGDFRTVINKSGSIVNRSLNTPSNYTTQVVNNVFHQANRNADGISKSKALEYARASDYSSVSGESDYNNNRAMAWNNPFISAISSVRGNVPMTNTFTYKDLIAIDPNVNAVTQYAALDVRKMSQVHVAGQTSDWHGSDISTKVAASLSHSVPALLMECLITKIFFKSTNHHINGQMVTQVIHGNSFSKMDMTLHYERFKQAFETLVLNEITYNNSLSYAIEMNVDLLGETWIKISIDNKGTYEYVTPSFSDGLFAPMITSNFNKLAEIGNDFSVLYDTVVEGFNPARSMVRTSYI